MKPKENQQSKAGPSQSPNNEFEIPSQQSDKAHCFCPVLAKEHGENAAVILQGLGYKVAKSKKVQKGQKWHYDTLEELQERWPYLSESGIHGIIQSQVDKGNVTKGKFNKWPRDPTTWYSVPQTISARALEKKGKFWFDVPVAIKCSSVVAGTIYQNIRFHLLSYLAENPLFTHTPYYRVRKASLTKVLPWSLSTVKRALKNLRDEKLIIENPATPGEFTLSNQADLVVPDAMKSAASNRSNSEKAGSSSEKAGSNVKQNGSNSDNITHYKPLERTIEKHHSQNAALGVCGVPSNPADANGHEQNSSTVSDKKNSFASNPDLPKSFNDITTRISILFRTTTEEQRNIYADYDGYMEIVRPDPSEPPLLSSAKIESSEPATVIQELYAIVHEESLEFEKLGCSKDACEFLTLTAIVSILSKTSDTPVPLKASSLRYGIRQSNQDGWPTYSDGDLEFNVALSKSFRAHAEEFFTSNPRVSAHKVWSVLSDCIEVAHLVPDPMPVFDKLWHARRGVNPPFLFKYWHKIQSSLKLHFK